MRRDPPVRLRSARAAESGSYQEPLYDRVMMPVMPVLFAFAMFFQVGFCLIAWVYLFGLATDEPPWAVLALPLAVPALSLLVMVLLTILARVMRGDLADAYESLSAYWLGAFFVWSPLGLTVCWLVAVPVARAAVALGMAETAAWQWIVLAGSGLGYLLLSIGFRLRRHRRSVVRPWKRIPDTPLEGSDGGDLGWTLGGGAGGDACGSDAAD